MLLNRIEYALMNNPIRAVVQRRLEPHRLLSLGGRMSGGVAREIGSGRLWPRVQSAWDQWSGVAR